MKILHTSDWHLGKRLEDFSRLEEQQAVLHEICELAEQESEEHRDRDDEQYPPQQGHSQLAF